MPDVAVPGLIGREAERQAVSRFLDAVPSGRAVLTIHGEPGMGKSLLFREAVSGAIRREYRVLVSRPGPRDATLSFSGLGDLLHPVVDEISGTLPEPQRRALEVALLLRESDDEPPGPLAVALAVRGALVALCRSLPLIVALDDSQWLDEPTAAALAHALRRLETEPIGLLAVAQPEGSVDPGQGVLASMSADEITRVRLASLSQTEIGGLLRARLGLSLTHGRLERLHRLCRGNPMIALEIAGAVVSARGAPHAAPGFPVPADLAGLLRNRLAGLPPESRQALLVMAAAAEPTRALIDRVAERSGGVTVLDLPALEGIVEEHDDRLWFTHPLFGSVLYADAEAEARRRVHRGLADAVEDPVERAMHLALGADGPDAEVADVLEEAARATRARGAPSAAAELCEQARTLTPTDGVADGHRRALLQAEYHLDAGELARSRALLEELLEVLPPGQARAAALQRLGWVRYHEDSWITASELFGEAAVAAGDDPALLASVELDRALASLVSGDVQGAAEHASSALERARQTGKATFLADASAMVASIDFLLGRGAAEEVMERAVEQETWSRPRPTLERPSVAYGVLLKWADQLEASRTLLDRARRRVEEDGSERSLPFILFHLAELECRAGNWATAAEEAGAASDIAERTGQDTGRAFALAGLAMVAALRGRVDEARTAATRGLAFAQHAGAVPAGVMLESVLGFLELSLGDAGRAHRHLGPLAEHVAEAGIFEPGALRYLGDAVEALAGVGDIDLASRITDDLARRSAELDRAWGLAVAARSRGLLLATGGDLVGAIEAYEAALVQHERLGQPFELGRTLLAIGVARRRDRQKRAAREALERALEIFQDLGADLWAGRARDDLARIGGRAASAVSLTPTEDRIARMVVEGATNQETAAALFLAVKTVEWNLSRIYRKLGIRSRTELARWLDAPRRS